MKSSFLLSIICSLLYWLILYYFIRPFTIGPNDASLCGFQGVAFPSESDLAAIHNPVHPFCMGNKI